MTQKSLYITLMVIALPLIVLANHGVEALGAVIELGIAVIVAFVCALPTFIHLVLKRVRSWTSIFWICWNAFFAMILFYLHQELDEGLVLASGVGLLFLAVLVALKAAWMRKVKKV